MRTNLPVTAEEYVLPVGEVIVSRTDDQGIITYVNEAFVRSSQFSREELLGQPQNIIRHPDMPAEAFADLWRTVRAGHPWAALVKNRRKSGGFYWVSANVSPIIEGGRVTGYMSVRTRPAADEVRHAAEIYRKLASGELRGRRLEGGRWRRTGVFGLLEKLLNVSFNTRCWATAFALMTLFATLAALGCFLPEGDLKIPMVGVSGFGVLFALGCGIWWSTQIGRPLREAAALTTRIIGGDLSLTLPRHGDAQLMELYRMVDQVSAKLVGVLKDVNASFNGVMVAAGEIGAGNGDLSQRTEEQASSLEETASSMEELTATVRQNADNSQQAKQLASAASSIAVKGGEVVQDVVRTMSSINASSRKIADIITVIDGIAFQTNILALNASVEAARAGEQGRGFAVVASEVRDLAQRSASAAKEIKQLIAASVHSVDEGTRLVDQAGTTMHDVVESVKRVADLMAEISAASAEQSAGIEQVNQAIVQMDHVTQQNASLVEELAAASETLQQQTHIAADAMLVLHLDNGGATPARQRKPMAAVSARTTGGAKKAPPAASNAVARAKRKVANAR